jgi:hypothetical protein
MKPYGFLQEDFHSEVLDFLFELIKRREPQRHLILYNTYDRYNNKILYKKRYDIEIRDLDNYIPDMVNNICEKIFVISYDNIFHFKLLLPYKDQLIFIAHSPKHIESFKNFNIEYFALTPLLSNKFMLPIKNDITQNLVTDTDIVIENKDKIKKDQNTLDHIKRLKDQGLTILMTIGSFFENNKDINLLNDLLKTKRYILIVYTNEASKELMELIQNNMEYVYASLNLPTFDIVSDINLFNIRYLLFVPPKKSKFTESSWSGSIQFAFDNNLHLIMPNDIANIYKINTGIITYNNTNDIISKIESGENSNYKHELQIIRNDIHYRNNIVFDVLMGKSNYHSIGQYKIENTNSNVLFDIDLYKNIFNTLQIHKGSLFGKTIIDIENDSCLFSLILLLLESSCYIKSFTTKLETAKMYKDIFIYNNINEKIKFFNATISNITSNIDSIDNFTLDYLNYDNIGIIHMHKSNIQNVLLGGKNTISKNKPILFVKLDIDPKNTENIDNQDYTLFLKETGYEYTIFDNYIIYNIKQDVDDI